jgi:hypothetical protein
MLFIMKTLNLSNSVLTHLNENELILIEGGRTDFAYDLGTFIRFTIQSASHQVGAAAATAASWYIQQ